MLVSPNKSESSNCSRQLKSVRLSKVITMNKSPRHSPQTQAHTKIRSIASFFQFDRLETTYRTEIVAGITTFMTLAYTLVVTPSILSNAIFLQQPGDLFDELIMATAIVSAIATLLISFWANYPFALAPGMGLNSLFTFSVVLDLKLDWHLALMAALFQGLVLMALCLSGLHDRLINAIPLSLKHATVAGIGLFIAYIALSGNPAPPTLGAGIIVAGSVTKTTLGSLANPVTLLAVIGLVFTAILMVRQVKGGMLWGILVTAGLGWILGIAPAPKGLIALPHFPVHLLGQAFTGFHYFTPNQTGNLIAATFILLFVTLFDGIGALMGLGQQAGRLNSNGELPRASQSLMAIGIGTMVGSLLGIPPVAPYLESAAGISEGGRSGFSSIIVTVLLLASILFIPLLAAVPAFATAPVLILVGVLIVGSSIRSINWNDHAEAIPAFLMILMTPLTFSLADGIAIGFITYPLLKVFQGKAHKVSWTLLFLAVLSVLFLVLMTGQKG
jgi:adenine/guanine/hypoxanthine permease